MRRYLLAVWTAALVGSLMLGSVAAVATTSDASRAAAVVVISSTGGTLGQRRLTQADAAALATSVDGIAALGRSVSATVDVAAGDQRLDARVVAVDPALPLIESWQLDQGTLFTQAADAAADRVALLGAGLASRLFPAGLPGLGQTVRIRGLPFTVIGVLADQPETRAAVIVPFKTGQVRLLGTRPIDRVALQAADAAETRTIAAQAARVLRQRHELPIGQADDFSLSIGGPSAQATAQPALAEVVQRMVQVVEWYACHAKDRCQ